MLILILCSTISLTSAASFVAPSITHLLIQNTYRQHMNFYPFYRRNSLRNNTYQSVLILRFPSLFPSALLLLGLALNLLSRVKVTLLLPRPVFPFTPHSFQLSVWAEMLAWETLFSLQAKIKKKEWNKNTQTALGFIYSCQDPREANWR